MDAHECIVAVKNFLLLINKTALIGMDGRKLVKQSIVLTDVLTKYTVSANFQFNKLPPIIVVVCVFNKINTMF